MANFSVRDRALFRLAPVLALSLLPGQVFAKPVYFNKPSVDRTVYLSDIGECEALADGVRAPVRPATYSSNIYAAGASAFFAGFFGSRERRAMEENVLRTCMADKSYRRVEADSKLMNELKALRGEARIDRLFSLAAETAPTGKMLSR
ncbi:MAG: hypothetical protein ABI898_02305 [Sphingomonadales bacterium]